GRALGPRHDPCDTGTCGRGRGRSEGRGRCRRGSRAGRATARLITAPTRQGHRVTDTAPPDGPDTTRAISKESTMTKTLVFTQYGGPENQELNDRELPEPGPKQIAIEVKAAGVNPADAKIRAGLMGDHWSLPAPMGREASGIVTALGSEVEDF